jgi:hypothetical protein
MPMRAQNQGYPFPGYPPEFAPSRTSRALPTPDLTPPPKFKKFEHSVPNQYVVVLNDDAVSQARTHVERRALVANLAKELAPGAAKIPYVWADALNGFCVELPNEAAAIALSQNPRVKYIESNGVQIFTTDTEDCPENSGLEALDRIDQISGLDRHYTYNRTGAGVTVYDIGLGAKIDHSEFGSRAFIFDDEVAKAGPPPGSPPETCNWKTATNNDCDGHGTAMLGIIGGTVYGVAKGATLGSIKFAYPFYTPSPTPTPPMPATVSDWTEYAWVISAINSVTLHHNDHPTQLEVTNNSWKIPPDPSAPDSVRDAVRGSLNSGVMQTIAASNENQSLDDPQTPRLSPRDVMDTVDGRKGALLVGAENQQTDYRWVRSSVPPPGVGSVYGSKLSLFSPGYKVRSANSDPNNSTNINDSTSRASAVAAGVVALYLQGRTGMNNCGSHPIQGPSSSTTGAAIATCPDRVSQFIRANANICSWDISGCQKINDRGASPDRLLYTGYLPPTDNFNFNPIDNQRFFVWQHYADFEDSQPEPNESGLDYWTKQITSTCTTDMNVNDTCTSGKRIDVSLAFWVDIHSSWFTTSYGLASYTGTDTANKRFVKECYWRYLRKIVASNDDGVNFWVNDVTNNYGGDPTTAAGVRHLIEAFITSGTSSDPGYRQRFGS